MKSNTYINVLMLAMAAASLFGTGCVICPKSKVKGTDMDYEWHRPDEAIERSLRNAKRHGDDSHLGDCLNESDVPVRVVLLVYKSYVSRLFKSYNYEISYFKNYVYSNSEELMIVSYNHLQEDGREVVRINKKTGEVFNPYTLDWERYAYVDDSAILDIKSFTPDMQFPEIIERIGEPYNIEFSNDGGLLMLEYINKTGTVTVYLKNGHFEEYLVLDNVDFM